MSRPAISVITPVYNGVAFLPDCIGSILRQTLPPSEVILIDDGSTDGSAAFLEAIEMPCTKRILRQQNSGQSAARNLGTSVATGTYLAFLDHDDIWHPRHLELLVAELEADPDFGWSYSDIDEIDHEGRLVQIRLLRTLNPEVQHPKTNIYNMLHADMFIFPSAAVVRRDAFLGVGGFDERLAGYEDDDLFLRLFRAGWQNAFLEDALVRYRRHLASSAFSERMWRSREIYAQKLMETFPDDPDFARFFVRDLIAPRFYRCGVDEYLRHLARGHWDLCLRALDVMRRYSSRCRLPAGRRIRRLVAFSLMAYPPLFARMYPWLRRDGRFR